MPLRRGEASSATSEAALEGLECSGTVRRVYSVLGPLVACAADRRSGAALAQDIALRDALQRAGERGYRLESNPGLYQRLLDAQGREHVLYVRVAGGSPTPKTVAGYFRLHRATLRKPGTGLILLTLPDRDYTAQLWRRANFQVWWIDQ